MISLAELQRRIDAGDLSADAAIAQSLEATSAHEKSIGAFVCRDESPRAQSAGPLRGIAVGIKDIMDTADFPTEMGSPIYRGYQPRGDAAGVMLLKQAGATVIVKEPVANGRLVPGTDDPSPAARRVVALAAELGVTEDAVALAAALAQPWATRVLSGAVTPEQVRSNASAADLELPPDALDGLAEEPAAYWAARSRRAWS